MQWDDHVPYETQNSQMTAEKPLDLSLRPPRNDETSSTSRPSSSAPSISSSVPTPFTFSNSVGIPRSQHRLSPYPALLTQNASSSKRMGSPCPVQSRSPLTRPVSPYYSYRSPSPYYPYPLSRSCTPPDNVTSLHALSSSHLINALVSSSSSRSLDSASPSRKSPKLKHVDRMSQQKQNYSDDLESEEPTYIDMDSSTPVKPGASAGHLLPKSVTSSQSYFVHQNQSTGLPQQGLEYYQNEKDTGFVASGIMISSQPSASNTVTFSGTSSPPVIQASDNIPPSVGSDPPNSCLSGYNESVTSRLCDSTPRAIRAECTSTTNVSGDFRTYYDAGEGKLVVDIGEYNISHQLPAVQLGSCPEVDKLDHQHFTPNIAFTQASSSSDTGNGEGIPPNGSLCQSPQLSPDSNISNSLSSSSSSLSQSPSNKENERKIIGRSNGRTITIVDKKNMDTASQNGDQATGSFKTLDFWLRKIYMDDSTRQRCGAEIRESAHGTTPKIRLRLDDLLDLQLNHSLKA